MIRSRVGFMLAALSLLSLILGLGLIGSRAWAFLVQGGAPASAPSGRLQLSVSESTPLHATLAPGDSTRWLIGAELTGAPEGALSVEVAAEGTLVTPRGLTIEALTCDEPFSVAGPSRSVNCAGVTSALIPRQPLSSVANAKARDLFALPPLRLGSRQELLVVLALPSNSAPAMGDRAAIGIGFHAAGDKPYPPTDVARTPAADKPVTTTGPLPDIPSGRDLPSSTPSVTSPPQTSGPSELALTGLNVDALLAVGLGLVGLGIAGLLRRPRGDFKGRRP